MSITTDKIVIDIQRMFKNINERKLNHWGVLSNQFAALACLKCSKYMYDYKKFAEFGPDLARNAFFCDEDIYEFYGRIDLLRLTSEEEGKKFMELYERAIEPVRKMEKEFKKISETSTATLEGKDWVFYG